jgi:uncharacterized membrane protein YkoI
MFFAYLVAGCSNPIPSLWKEHPMKSLLWSLVVVALLASACGVQRTYAQKKNKFTAKDLPAAVTAAFHKAYPSARILDASTETEKGVKYYEIESKDGSTRRDLLYMEDGKVYETEETVAPGNLPESVKSALAKDLPKGKILKVEKTTRGDVVAYELAVKANGKEYSVTIDPAGKVVEKKAMKAKENEEKEEQGEENEKD